MYVSKNCGTRTILIFDPNKVLGLTKVFNLTKFWAQNIYFVEKLGLKELVFDKMLNPKSCFREMTNI